MPDRLIWRGAWKGEIKSLESLFCSFKDKQTQCLCIVAFDGLYFFFFFFKKLLSSPEFHPWSLSVFLQAQRLWHQVLLYMAGQSQNQTMHKTWVSFQGHSDAFIHSYYAHRKTQTYMAASISSSSNPLHLSDFSNEAMNWSVSTAGSCNNIINRREGEKCGFTICLN